MPRTRAISATFVPMAPVPPTSPMVLPVSSKCGVVPSDEVKSDLSPLASATCCGTMVALKLRTKVMTRCATASVE